MNELPGERGDARAVPEGPAAAGPSSRLPRTWRPAALWAAGILLAVGCYPRAEHEPAELAPDRSRTRGIRLTVADGAAAGAGRQTVEFAVDLGRAGKATLVPLKHAVTVEGVGGKVESLHELCGLSARIRWQAWPIGGSDADRVSGVDVIDCSPAMKEAKIADGALRGAIELDRAAFRAEVDRKLREAGARHPGLSWRVEASLLVSFDNTELRDRVQPREGCAFVNAEGWIQDWMRWTYPQATK